jgi:thiol:disulfide interchange protein
MRKLTIFVIAVASGVLVMEIVGGFAAEKKHGGPAWKLDYSEALKVAGKEEKLVVLDFYAEWCGACKLMDRDTYSKDKVIKALSGYVPLKIDVDEESALAEKYKVVYLPTTLVLDAEGDVILSAEGYLDPKDFISMLKKATEKVDASVKNKA